MDDKRKGQFTILTLQIHNSPDKESNMNSIYKQYNTSIIIQSQRLQIMFVHTVFYMLIHDLTACNVWWKEVSYLWYVRLHCIHAAYGYHFIILYPNYLDMDTALIQTKLFLLYLKLAWRQWCNNKYQTTYTLYPVKYSHWRPNQNSQTQAYILRWSEAYFKIVIASLFESYLLFILKQFMSTTTM